jgi:hypothetical protein
MASHRVFTDRDDIVIGSILPFSVYSADGKLLLAKGQVVESERARDQLIYAGKYQSSDSASELTIGENGRHETSPVVEKALDAYVREFHGAVGSSRVGVRVSREEAGDSFPCWILGADELHDLIITAPSKPDRSIVPVNEGQTWVFRMMYLTAAVKFNGVIRKVQFEPTPLMNVSLPKQVELRHVRASPRVATCIPATVDYGKELPVLIIDIGIGGMRIAMERACWNPEPGYRITLIFNISMLGQDYHFKVPATVVTRPHDMDKRYPALGFAGLKIEAQSELEKLVLHSYVFEHTALDFNALWKALTKTV